MLVTDACLVSGHVQFKECFYFRVSCCQKKNDDTISRGVNINFFDGRTNPSL